MLSEELDSEDSSNDLPLIPRLKFLMKKWGTQSPYHLGPSHSSSYSLVGAVGQGCTIPNTLPHMSFLFSCAALLLCIASSLSNTHPLSTACQHWPKSTFIGLPPSSSPQPVSSLQLYLLCFFMLTFHHTNLHWCLFLEDLRHVPHKNNSGTDITTPVKENPAKLTKSQIHLLSGPVVPLLGIHPTALPKPIWNDLCASIIYYLQKLKTGRCPRVHQ